MNDRELLELAAKAAGMTLSDEWDSAADGILIGAGDGDLEVWNPLVDDGSALRLAVRLRMEIDHNHPADQVPWASVRAAPNRMCAVEEFVDESQRAAATRRAIVRAAAEIGLQHK